MLRRSRRSQDDPALVDEVVARSQVVGQLLFVEEDEDGVVTIDVVALSVRHPSGRSAPGSGFELRLRMPQDPMWGHMFGRVLSRWADENRVVGLDFGAGDPPVITVRSVDCTMRFDLVTDSLF